MPESSQKAHWAEKSSHQIHLINKLSLATKNSEFKMGKFLSFNKSFFNDHFPRQVTRAMQWGLISRNVTKIYFPENSGKFKN
jgi:hypothetical protein